MILAALGYLPGSSMLDHHSLIRTVNETCFSDCMTHDKPAAMVRTRVGTGCFLLCAGDHLDGQAELCQCPSHA